MKKIYLIGILLLVGLVSSPVLALEGAQYGPFTAVKMDQTVVEDVAVEGNDIYVKISPAYQESVFVVKISNENMASYRDWESGDAEMLVKVYRSQKRNKKGYTYRINTVANFVEYWTGGRLVLQLERMR